MSDIRYIPLTRGAVAKIDARDWPLVSAFKWKLHSRYAGRQVGPRGNRYTVLMHRFILGPRHGFDVDHANGDTLDNRRANLRECTASQNQANRRPNRRAGHVRFKGVTQRGNRFVARIDGRSLGTFDNEFDAAVAYDRAAVEQYGAFARLNVPWLTTKSA